jgi:hypothetical protein
MQGFQPRAAPSSGSIQRLHPAAPSSGSIPWFEEPCRAFSPEPNIHRSAIGKLAASSVKCLQSVKIKNMRSIDEMKMDIFIFIYYFMLIYYI